MAILNGYGVGKNLLAFIKRILDGDMLAWYCGSKKSSLGPRLM
jgi:hypothetical protein